MGSHAQLRIGLVTPGFPPELGGVEMVVGQLSAALAERQHHVHVLTHRPRKSDLQSGVYGPNIEVERFADWTGTRQFPVAPGLWLHVRRHSDSFDVLHAHSFHASAAMAASSMTKRPLVFTPHYHGVGHTRGARALHIGYDRFAARIFDRASSVVCVSKSEADLVERDYPRAAGKIAIIPNGVDVEGIRAAQPFEFDRPVILIAGRLEAYKQVASGIRALRHAGPDPLMVVAGTGSQLPALRALSVELGLADRVRFLGFVENTELQRWQRTATVTLTLSQHEAFGLVVLEAAAAGSRIVASAIPAHVELTGIVGDFTSLVPTDASPARIASAIRQELVHSNAGVRQLDTPTWSAIAGRTIELYDRAIDGGA